MLRQFDIDVKVANKTEDELSSMLAKQWSADIIHRNNDNKYDTKFRLKNGTEFTVEFKEDFTCARTGNIGIEYHCRGKPSGISVSKADFYCIKAHRPSGYEVLLFKSSAIKKAIENRQYIREVNGGDVGSDSLNYLFTLSFMKSIRIGK